MARTPASAPARARPKAAAAPRKTAAKPKSAPAKSNTLAWSLGGLALAAGAGLVVFLTRGRIGTLLAGEARGGHVPTDLLDPDRVPGEDRAPVAFRPDMSAPMTPAERAALAPATGGAPSLVGDRGAIRSEVGPNG